MNLRAIGLLAAATSSMTLAAHSQAYQGGYAPQPLTDANGNPLVSGPQAVQAGQQYGFLTNAQTASLFSAISQTFVPGYTPGSPGTTASLLANVPASAANVGQYAVVSDLFGSTNEVLRSGYTAGVGYYWRPQRTDYAASITSTGGALMLTPLQNAPYIYLSGQLASSLTISLSSANAWPGATFCVSNNLTLGLATVSLQATGLPSTNMVSGASKCFAYDGANWRPF